MERKAQIHRVTNETDIFINLNVDGVGNSTIDTGIGFFDHMLNHIALHGFFDLDVKVKGDLYVDDHHTVEDTAIVLGQCIKQALDDKRGIKRYGSVILPMDESLVLCAIDLSGRPYLNFDVPFTVSNVGMFATEMVEEFFRALCVHVGMNLHIKLLDGKNNHHIIEAVFKAFGRTLDMATQIDPRIKDVLSTKGSLD